jgi:steroid delta-isomerase-like uncharacterized protein
VTSDEIRQIFEGYWSDISAGRLDNLEKYFTEDAVFEDTTLGHVWRGRADIVGVLRKFFSVMPSRLEIETFHAGGDGFGIGWINTAVHTSNVLGFPPPTGKTYRFRGASIGKIRDGRIAYKADYWDRMTALEQIQG